MITQAKVGATNYDAGVYPQVFGELGINPRTSPRNELLGTTFTRPDDRHRVIGISYVDHLDDAPANDDPFLFDFDSGKLEQLRPDALTRRFPEYGPFHHGTKPYFFGTDET